MEQEECCRQPAIDSLGRPRKHTDGDEIAKDNGTEGLSKTSKNHIRRAKVARRRQRQANTAVKLIMTPMTSINNKNRLFEEVRQYCLWCRRELPNEVRSRLSLSSQAMTRLSSTQIHHKALPSLKASSSTTANRGLHAKRSSLYSLTKIEEYCYSLNNTQNKTYSLNRRKSFSRDSLLNCTSSTYTYSFISVKHNNHCFFRHI